ncbi:competence type IV pilus ATPase ComGA [Staphylococcus sp. SQ8-PEA]|uniref:Competence type IV pilus ATPase ComGA n=1 Tax=Staphylococcus marylandisciuri TaxID=2981529 RepID=A0ABT2QQV5_9STAP|nr:competence type IV pilus ATPase ComGA [Staphylococcus marylandisciuri]MCU5746364.1 competence type IV pilus ATPase ComGA [Staphylococcus marylandisciuri]
MKLLFKEIISRAINKEASDVHFIPAEEVVYIKFRINDNLINFETVNRNTYSKLLTYMKYLAGLDVSTHITAQSGRYLYQSKQPFYLRISTLPLSLGIESCVIRLIPQYFKGQKDSKSTHVLYNLMNKKQGLILFSGPTGSGKSTLMYQMILHAKKKLNANIITVEDPIEQRIEGITQITINEKAGITYSSSFKAILRCDPDIILIGEIRDNNVAKYVIQASLSGHLVLSTIHASDCVGTLLRLREMGITEQEIKQSVLNITNQRLLPNSEDQRELVCEMMSKADINYFFANKETLPFEFNNLSCILSKMSKEGVICEETIDRYL